MGTFGFIVADVLSLVGGGSLRVAMNKLRFGTVHLFVFSLFFNAFEYSTHFCESAPKQISPVLWRVLCPSERSAACVWKLCQWKIAVVFTQAPSIVFFTLSKSFNSLSKHEKHLSVMILFILITNAHKSRRHRSFVS